MSKSQQVNFKSLYRRHVSALKRQGKTKSTIDVLCPRRAAGGGPPAITTSALKVPRVVLTKFNCQTPHFNRVRHRTSTGKACSTGLHGYGMEDHMRYPQAGMPTKPRRLRTGATPRIPSLASTANHTNLMANEIANSPKARSHETL